MLEVENAKTQGKSLQGKRTLETNKPLFLGQDPRQSPKAKHKWRARHTRRSHGHLARGTRPRCPRARSAPRRCSDPPAWLSGSVRLRWVLSGSGFAVQAPGWVMRAMCYTTPRWARRRRLVGGQPAAPGWPQDAASSSHTSGSSGSLAASLLPCVLQGWQGNKEIVGTEQPRAAISTGNSKEPAGCAGTT